MIVVEDDSGAKPSSNGAAPIGTVVSLVDAEGGIRAAEVADKICEVGDVVGMDSLLDEVIMGEVRLGVEEMRSRVVNAVEVLVA